MNRTSLTDTIMSLAVLQAGLFTLPVDRGRTGFRALGVPLGGAADRAAFDIANALLGNHPDSVALEITMAGPTLRANHRTWAAFTGAPFQIHINDALQEIANSTFTLEAGDRLRIGGTPIGCRGYLSVCGGFDLPLLMGSRTAGEPLKIHDELRCGTSDGPRRGLQQENEGPPEIVSFRTLPGAQADWFPDRSFYEAVFTVDARSNRMGIRLNGPSVPKRASEMISEPVAVGAVQITNEGLPIVLGVDGQTIGGYPKIAHLIRADFGKLAQLRPGMQIRFEEVTADAAEAAARDQQARLQNVLLRLAVTLPHRNIS